MTTHTAGAAPQAVAAAAAPKRRGRGRQERHEALTGWFFMAPFALLFVLVFVIPIVVSVIESFYKRVPGKGGLFGGGEPVRTFIGMANYAEVATNPAFWTGIGRVVGYAAVQIPLMIGLALGLALLLDSFLVRRPGFFRLSYFLPYAIPGVVAAMVWLYLYSPGMSPFLPYLPRGHQLHGTGSHLVDGQH